MSGGSVKLALGDKKPESKEQLFPRRQSSETMVWGSPVRFCQVSGVPNEMVAWLGEKNGGSVKIEMSREGVAPIMTRSAESKISNPLSTKRNRIFPMNIIVL